MSETCDIVVIGAGIVGLATALALQSQEPKARIVVLEKEVDAATHQTGRNSGVIHAGVYYAPGSLKARLCRAGREATEAFCSEHGIPFERCGKLIVATHENELERLAALETRAKANGIEIERLSGEAARALEPRIASIAALLSPSTGIVDYGVVARKMAQVFVSRGGTLRTGITVRSGTVEASGVSIDYNEGQLSAGMAVAAAGLYADRLARAFGTDPGVVIVPFRGEYWKIANQPADLVSRLIYPVPDPERPFLGVHLTRKLDGGFTVGPNAVLALSREGYGWSDISARDLSETLTRTEFWRLIARNFVPALDETAGSLSKRLYLRKVQRYCPQIALGDLKPYRSGVRAQAVAQNGKLVEDFHFAGNGPMLHVLNAPSPAATAALPIGQMIADRLLGGNESAPIQ